MQVNGNEISYIEVLSKVITPSSFESNSKWNSKSLIPITTKSKFTYGNMKLELLVRGNTENIVQINASNFLKEISESTVKFGEFNYKVRISSLNIDDVCEDSWDSGYYQKLTLNLIVDEKFRDEIVTDMLLLGSEFTFNVEGNITTPCVIEITPTQAMVDLVISGVSEYSFIVKNLAKDETLIIDGENQTITVNGENKFLDTEDMWEFPYLSPGSNTITFSKSYLTATVKYKPRYV